MAKNYRSSDLIHQKIHHLDMLVQENLAIQLNSKPKNEFRRPIRLCMFQIVLKLLPLKNELSFSYPPPFGVRICYQA